MSDALTLADVVGRGISVEWPEGVAVIRGVVARLPGTPGQAHLVPDLHQIEISRTGRIDVTGGTSADEPIRRLGQLLQATLRHSEPPVQLRLIISQAMAPTPEFSSIHEYDAALRYFERPNRDAVLQSLYARAAAAPSVAIADSKLELDAIAGLPASVAPKATRVRPRIAPRTVRLVVSGVLGLFVSAAVIQYVRITGVARGKNQVSAVALRASEAVGDALVAGVSAVTERVGLGRLVPAEAVAEESPTPLPSRRVKTTATDRAPLVIVSAIPLFAAFDLEAVPTLERASADLTPASDFDAFPENDTPPVEASTEDGGPGDEPVIYSSESLGVSSPVTVRPQLPRELPSDVNPSDLGRIELVVLPDGAVESVKLLGPARSVHEAMLLSAAKAWHFQPAMKGGVPVRYRKTIWIAPQ